MSNIFKYNPSLDGLRGIAVICVLLVHASYGVISGGFLGVDLFFVLSGYLITAILQKEYGLSGTISYLNFYMKRILRLLPPLALCILMYMTYRLFVPSVGVENPLLIIFSSLFYFVNVVHESHLGPMVHLWSLSVEEHFYLFWPVLVAGLLFKFSKNKQMAFVFFLVLLTSLFRIWVYHTNSVDPIRSGIFSIDSYRFTFCRIDAILLGAFAALALADKTYSFKAKITPNLGLVLLLIPLALLVLVLDAKDPIWRYGGFMLTNTLALFLVVFAIFNPNNRLLANSILLWFGQRSYGIYVYHYLIFEALEPMRIAGNTSNFILVTFLRLLISLLFAEVSYRLMEKPILKLKKKFQNPTSKNVVRLENS